MATHSSVLAWRIPGTGEPGGLPSMRSQSWTRLKRLGSSSSSCSRCGHTSPSLSPLASGMASDVAGFSPSSALPRPRPWGCQTSCCSPSPPCWGSKALSCLRGPWIQPHSCSTERHPTQRGGHPQPTPRMFPWASAWLRGHYVAAAEQAANLGPSTAPGPLRTLAVRLGWGNWSLLYRVK